MKTLFQIDGTSQEFDDDHAANIIAMGESSSGWYEKNPKHGTNPSSTSNKQATEQGQNTQDSEARTKD